MTKYLIQVIQQGLPTTIIISLLTAYAVSIGRKTVRKWQIRGILLGFIGALILAGLKYYTVWINREYVNIVVLIIVVLFELCFIIMNLLMINGRFIMLGQRISLFSQVLSSVMIIFYVFPDIFLYPTEFVLRGESMISTEFLFKLIGYLFGVFVLFLVAISLYQVALSLEKGISTAILLLTILINMITQVVAVIQPLLARRIIPMQKWLFALIKPVINYNDYFLFFILVVSFILPIILWFKSYRLTGSFANSAEKRKAKWQAKKERRWVMAVLAGYLFAVISLTAIKSYANQDVVLSPAEDMTIVEEEILIPLTDIEDGHLHRFIYTASDDTEVRLIVIKKNEVAYGVGLDACDICGPTGYYERDDEVVCKLCDVVMNKSTIGFKGGCNPVPLTYIVRDGQMVIQIEELEAEKSRFA